MIKHIGVNTEGRDFVCGDIHGAFSRLEQFLEQMHFDQDKDRLFSVGDLVDRGPQNEECLNLLYEPWFFAVKGNHEVMMEDGFSGQLGGWANVWLSNGGIWANEHIKGLSDISMHVRDAVHDKVSDLPLMMTVDMKDGKKFHVIHAELWADSILTDEDLDNPYYFGLVSKQKNYDGECVLWGRRIFIRLFDKDLTRREVEKFKTSLSLENKHLAVMFNPKLSHIYSGHTIVRRPIQFYGQTNLDTMAYGSYSLPSRYGVEPAPKWAGLTITEPATGRFWLVNDHGVNEVEPLIIT